MQNVPFHYMSETHFNYRSECDSALMMIFTLHLSKIIWPLPPVKTILKNLYYAKFIYKSTLCLRLFMIFGRDTPEAVL